MKKCTETTSLLTHLMGEYWGRSVTGRPSFFWESLQPALSEVSSVFLQQEEMLYEGIHVSNEAPPLSFEFEQAEEDGYHLDIQGLEQISVLEDYGMVLSEGKLLKLSPQECIRLAEMKKCWIPPAEMVSILPPSKWSLLWTRLFLV